jgi:hypothetical protein
MSQIEITLPDGSKKAVEAGSSPLDIAKSISPRLADAAIGRQGGWRTCRADQHLILLRFRLRNAFH